MNFGSTLDDESVNALPPHGLLEVRPGWLAGDQADQLFDCLAGQIDWQTRTITMFGRTLLQPRLLCFMGDAGVSYRYSNDDYQACRWHPEVLALRERLRAESMGDFNSVLLNYYRDGQDSMGWHADDEPELGTNPVIVSISLGAVRRFVLRSRHDHGRKVELQPAHGSLIRMSGDLQHHWQHQIPRTAKPVGARINLTFRRIQARRHRPRP